LEIGGTILEDCESRELFFKGVGERKDLLALPTGRLGPREDWNLRGVTAGVCWNLRSVTVGGCWTMREMGLSVQAKSEQGGGVTITNCCALARVSIPWCDWGRSGRILRSGGLQGGSRLPKCNMSLKKCYQAV